MTADRDDLDAILAKHDDWINNQDGTQAICDCQSVISTSNSWTECEEAHRAHVAQMVLESDWLRGVRAKELRDAAAECAVRQMGEKVERENAHRAKKGSTDEFFHYGKQRAWGEARILLRDRADRVDAEDTDNTTDRT